METKNGLLERLSNGNWKKCLELLTLFFIGVEILWQECRVCYFTLRFMQLSEHLYQIESYTLRAGFALTAANVLCGTGWRSSRRVIFLYGICLLDGLASFRAGGVELAWIQQLTREIITVVLFYCAAQSVREGLLGRLLHLFYWLWLLPWSMMCCLSLGQFALMFCEGSRIINIMQLLGVGYYGHRLFGVFTWPEYRAVISLLIMLAGGYYFVSTRSRAERVLLALCNVPLLFYIVLSRSRNAQVAFYLSLFLGTGIVHFKRSSVSWTRGRRRLMAMMVAFFVVAGAHLGYVTIQRTSEHIPNFFSDYFSSLSKEPSPQSSSPAESTEESEEQTEIPEEETETLEEETKNRLLDRIDTEGNIATNRFSIWKDYLSLWKEYGLFGLSSTYDSWYIKEHHPDLFICTYVAGSVYHTHNGYLKTLVSSGYLGFTFLMLFLLGGALDVWKALKRSEKIPPKMLFALLVVVAGCFSTMFDLEIFFVFNPITYIFWLALGILMKLAGEVGAAEKRVEMDKRTE